MSHSKHHERSRMSTAAALFMYGGMMGAIWVVVTLSMSGVWQKVTPSPARCAEIAPLLESKVKKKLDTCSGYDGVLRIRSGDEGAASGTVFFLYIINHLIYAEMYNLLPWVHLDGTSHRIYDEKVHGGGPTVSFRMLPGKIRIGESSVPEAPKPPSSRAETELFEVTGNGVWESYFEPISDFSPAYNRTCVRDKPLYEINYNGVSGGLHHAADWTVRAWLYGRISESWKTKTIREWYRPMRQRAASMVRRYIRPKPWLLRAADLVNPLEEGQKCIALHVRTTDKELSGGRREVPLREYLPHVKSFLKKFGPDTTIFLATDSSTTLRMITKEWPTTVAERVRSQANIIHSSSSEPVFDLASHHRTNSEVLTDIYAMAKCTVLIHGRSAVSESVLYINPDIREASVDVEGEDQTLELEYSFME